MKHAKELAYLRQLCCMGLPKETFLPEFLLAVTNVIPSQNNTYSGVDPTEFKPGDLSMSVEQLDMINTIQQVMYDYWIPERANRVASWFKNHWVLTDFAVFDEDYKNSDLMNLVFWPLDQYHPLLVFIRSQDKLIGAINLFRSRSQKPFNNHEQTLLLRLMPYVNHAFQNQNAHDLQYVNQGVSGMVLMDKAGNILYQNATAERLLLIASYPLVPMDSIIKIRSCLVKIQTHFAKVI